MDECVSLKFSINNKDCKININHVFAILRRKLLLRCNNGASVSKIDDIITIPLAGCVAGEEVEEKVVKLDLNLAQDLGTPVNLSGAFGEFAGKIQGTCNGKLINVSYELHIVTKVDGCLCFTPHPFVYAPIEILAPERVLVFAQTIYAPIPAEQFQNLQPVDGIPIANSQQVVPAQYPPPGISQVPALAPGYLPAPAPAPDGTNQQLQNVSPEFATQQYKAPDEAIPVQNNLKQLEQKEGDNVPIEDSKDV